MELRYSVRLTRWSSGAPAYGCSAAARSIDVSTADRNALSVAASGRGAPDGGMRPARSLWIIFSAVSACLSACAGSKFCSDKPPALPSASWHPRQYSFRAALSGSGVAGLEAWDAAWPRRRR